MVDFLMMFSLCICVLSGVTLLIVHIWSKKKQKKEEAEDKTGGTVFHSGTRNVPGFYRCLHRMAQIPCRYLT